MHPQSIVHSLRRRCATARRWRTSAIPTCACRSPTRCTIPTASTCPSGALDLAEVGSLTFEPVDAEAFPCLRLAREAAVAGGTAPCVLNAANEVAVHAFLDGRLPFLGIPAVIEETLARLPAQPVRAFESLYEADREARAVAAERAGALA